MVIKEEGEVVGDQILAAATEVERVEVLKLSPHVFEGLLGDARFGDEVIGQLGSAEDVVPDLIDHLISRDISFASVPP